MKSHMSEDTDEENCDDPIKLFDNDINAVYFGSQPNGHRTTDTESRWEFETIGNDVFCQPRDNSALRRPDDVVQTLQSGMTSECDISPLCIKLVDCGKFPWYFRKYTQQIMNNINLNQDSDSDRDIDVEGIVEDSDDCYIVEDLQDLTNRIITNDQICINKVKSTGPKPKVHKNKLNESLEVMKRRRDDLEIQKALSVKNLLKVDLKRNQGLVGIKITQKIEINTTLDVKMDGKEVCNEVEEADAKQICAIADDEYLNSAEKTLYHFGTQLIPVTEERETNSICQFKVNVEEKDLIGRPTLITFSSCKPVPVKFDISKISEKLINNLKIKKINDQSSETKLISKPSNKSVLNNPENKLNISNEKELMIVNEKELSSRVTDTENLTHLSSKITSHVKDVKKTNKYKNDQKKCINSAASHSSLIGLLVTNKSKEDVKEIKCMKRKRRDNIQSEAAKLDKKPRKKIKKQKREPNSPILHCSTVPKKPKHEIPPKCNKSDTKSNLPKELSKLKQIVDKLTQLNSCNLVQDTNQQKHLIPKVAPVTKPFAVHTKEALQKVSCMIQDKTLNQVSNIHVKPLNVSETLPKNYNDASKTVFKTNKFHNTQNMSLSQNKTLNEQNVLHESHQDNANKHKINTTSVTNRTHKANNKPTICNSNVSRENVVSPASGSKSVLSNQYANFPTTHRAHFPIHNTVPNKMSSRNIPNNNINFPVQNRYASAIILKSNNQTNFPFEKYCEPPLQTMAVQRSMTILSHTQPRCRDPQPPYPVFYPPAPSDRRQTYFHSANSVPNQFLPPHGHISQRPSTHMQDFYRECWLPLNLAPPPPPPPPPPPDSPLNIPPKSGHNVNQSEDCFNSYPPPASLMQNPQGASRQNSVNTFQTTNSSIIGMNNDGLVKKINIVAMPVKKNVSNKIGTVKVEQIKIAETVSPLEDQEVVATKTEMLKELDKLSFVDKEINDFKRIYPASIIDENKKENTLEVAIMSKKPGRFETLKLTMNQKENPTQTKPAQGYSPPILPIPTYQKVLNRVTSNSQTQSAIPNIALRPGDPRSNLRNESKPLKERDYVKSCKRKFSNACNNDEDSRRKYDAKKISLEEYKKRILKNDCKPELKKICKEKYNNGEKRPNIEFKCRKKVDYSTETDLGYDSDSTVVL